MTYVLLILLIGFLAVIGWLVDKADRLTRENTRLEAMVKDREENIKRLCER
jgi:hypothetical protein